MTPCAIEHIFESHPDAARCSIRLLGIRGYQYGPTGQNQLGIYDDAIVRVLDGEYRFFTASTDPGKYWIRHPMNPSGCARLCTGLWYYQIGSHKGHSALVPCMETRVDRLNENGDVVSTETGNFSINLHSGGPVEDEVGRYSAGCQIIASREPWGAEWKQFFNPIMEMLHHISQARIPYLLIDSLLPTDITDQRWSVNNGIGV